MHESCQSISRPSESRQKGQVNNRKLITHSLTLALAATAYAKRQVFAGIALILAQVVR